MVTAMHDLTAAIKKMNLMKPTVIASNTSNWHCVAQSVIEGLSD